MTESLPSYQSRLAAFHRAFRAELRAIIRSLPLTPGMRVLDVGCGDGFYDFLLAERLQSPGSVTGLDSNAAYVDLARSSLAEWQGPCEIDFIHGKLEELPRQHQQWDLVWCAQSLYSLPDPVAALSQMARAVRPGGFVVILENDTLHELLMPWPPQIEIALRAAEWKSFADSAGRTSKYYVGRRLPAVFAEAGLEPLHFRTQCIDRQAPLDPDVRQFLELYLLDLMSGARDYLSPSLAEAMATLIDSRHPNSLLAQPYFTMSWINALAWGRTKLGY